MLILAIICQTLLVFATLFTIVNVTEDASMLAKITVFAIVSIPLAYMITQLFN